MIVMVGDVLFVKGTGLVSKMIQWVTGGKWSHCAIFLDENTLLETEWSTKCRIINIEDTDYLTKEHEVIPIKLTKDQEELLKVVTYMTLGKKYDFWMIFKLFLKSIFGWKVKKHSYDTLVCSELVGYVLLSLGVFTYDEAHIANTSPSELYNILKAKEE